MKRLFTHTIAVVALIFITLSMPGAVAAQSRFAGTWEGRLAHGSCIGTSTVFNMKLQLKEENDRVSGTVSYYLAFPGVNSLDYAPLFSFPVSAAPEGKSVVFRYQASQEYSQRGFAMGYYILGSYSLMLDLATAQGDDLISGLYRGGNGGRGEVWLRRGQLAGTATASTGQLLARLRAEQQGRKMAQTAKPGAAPATPPPVWKANDSLAALFTAEQTTYKNMQARNDSLHQTIVLPDSVAFAELRLYDNAQVDGDSISLFLDSVLVMHRRKVSAEPLTYRLYKPDITKTVVVKVVAENMGSIPPNTALMEVEANGWLRRVYMKSDFKSNGTIIFKWTL